MKRIQVIQFLANQKQAFGPGKLRIDLHELLYSSRAFTNDSLPSSVSILTSSLAHTACVIAATGTQKELGKQRIGTIVNGAFA